MTPLLLTLFTLSAAPAITVERDVLYATAGGEKLMLDIARPTTPGPYPVLVGFHGGAWKYGNRRDLSKPVGGMLDFGSAGPRSLIELIAEQGYVVVSASYRLAPTHKWPAQIEDAKTAIRFLRANAKKYDIDPEHVGAFGFSAGGHIVALLGTVDKSEGLEGTLYPEHSSKVQCVVDYFGPTDLTLYAESDGLEKAYMKPFLGAKFKDKPDVYKQASPLFHVKSNAAPTLIVHGTADVIVPIIHSERFLEKLTEANVPSRMITVKGKGHGWEGQPAVDARIESVKFFDSYLKAKK
jgi:acetyl esterase/lipase